MELSDHVVVSGADGRLVGRSTRDVAALLDSALTRPRVVVHLHGGLVDEAAGKRLAASLVPVYSGADAFPVFLVWQAGIREVLRNNVLEIAREELFERLLGRVLGWAVGRVRGEEEGVRGAGSVLLPSQPELVAELGGRRRLTDPEAGAEPFAGQPLPERDPGADGEPYALPPEDEAEFLRQVTADAELQRQVAAAAADRGLAWGEADGTRGAPTVEPVPSRIDDDVLAEIAAGEEEGARGLVSAAVLARKALQVLRAVLLRYRTQTDSGVYTTVVEEVLRAFYLGSVGGALWQAMKKETEDTFSADHTDRAGRLLLDRLAARRLDDEGPRLTLVGHSTGAVFIDNLLTAAAGTRPAEAAGGSSSGEFQVCFLAPACTTQHFGQTLDVADDLIGRFRMFTMTDEAERADRLVGAVYPRSLLYLVSGLLERDRGASAVAPVLGMSRYLAAGGLDRLLGSDDAVTARLARVRRYTTEADRLVLSPSPADAPADARSSACSHPDFDEDPLVRASLVRLIESW